MLLYDFYFSSFYSKGHIIILVIGIGQDQLARWQESIFIFINNDQGILAQWQRYTFIFIGIGQAVFTQWQKSDTSKLLVLARVYLLDDKNFGRLPKIIKPAVFTYLEQFWNNKNLVRLNYFKTQINIKYGSTTFWPA